MHRIKFAFEHASTVNLVGDDHQIVLSRDGSDAQEMLGRKVASTRVARVIDQNGSRAAVHLGVHRLQVAFPVLFRLKPNNTVSC